MKQTLKAEGISTTFRKLYNLPTLNNWIIAASFANILFRLYVINKYYNSVYMSSTFIMLSNVNYYTWTICRTQSGNNFEIKLTQRRVIGVNPRFCDANWSGVIRAPPPPHIPLPTKAFNYFRKILPNLTYCTWWICLIQSRNNFNQPSLRYFNFKII